MQVFGFYSLLHMLFMVMKTNACHAHKNALLKSFRYSSPKCFVDLQ